MCMLIHKDQTFEFLTNVKEKWMIIENDKKQSNINSIKRTAKHFKLT